MDRQSPQPFAPQLGTPRLQRVKDDELRKQVLRERGPLGGGGPRLETGNTVDTTILNGAKLTLGGA